MPDNTARRRVIKTIIIVVTAIAGLAVLVWQMYYQQQVVRLHGNTFHTTVLQSQEDLTRGLSGSASLPAGRAVLFVFPNDEPWAIWMKDMNYPIDIVWLDKEKKVVHMVKNAQPSSYPQTQFKPDKPTRYVIELPSGTIEQTGIAIGDPAGLPSGV